MINKFNNDIEYLRAISIILVLIAHYNFMFPFLLEAFPLAIKTASYGVGVDLFFCISGYVVSKAYTDYFDKYNSENKFWLSAFSFWLRRCYRLLPSAWLWVFIGLVLSVCLNSTGIFETPIQNVKSAISIMFFSANISHMYDFLKPNNIYWSLSLEEQFYFLFPFFLAFIVKAKYRVLFLLIIIAIQFPLSRNAFGEIHEQYFSSFRTDGFAWGILIYIFSKTEIYKKINPLNMPHSKLLLSILLTILLILLTQSPLYFDRYGMGIVAMISATLVWLASYNSGNINIFFAKKQMVWLGKHSYAIYLIHFVIIRLTFELATIFHIKTQLPLTHLKYLYVILSILLIIYLAGINYKYIENPLRLKGKIKAEILLLSNSKK